MQNYFLPQLSPKVTWGSQIAKMCIFGEPNYLPYTATIQQPVSASLFGNTFFPSGNAVLVSLWLSLLICDTVTQCWFMHLHLSIKQSDIFFWMLCYFFLHCLYFHGQFNVYYKKTYILSMTFPTIYNMWGPTLFYFYFIWQKALSETTMKGPI